MESACLYRPVGKCYRWPLGANLFDAKLAFALSSPLGRQEIKARAENEYVIVHNAMYEVAKDVYAQTHP